MLSIELSVPGTLKEQRMDSGRGVKAKPSKSPGIWSSTELVGGRTVGI